MGPLPRASAVAKAFILGHQQRHLRPRPIEVAGEPLHQLRAVAAPVATALLLQMRRGDGAPVGTLPISMGVHFTVNDPNRGIGSEKMDAPLEIALSAS
jgi:hypothetical protein